MLQIPPGGCSFPLGVLSAIDACFNGELISIASFLLASASPLTGDERKKRGEDDATFWRDARGVVCELICGDSGTVTWFGGLEPVAGLLPGC